jgi:sugar/nucleoside kinase (ribokinase family)
MMKEYDITFVGHMCYDEIRPYQGETVVAPGSAVLCGAMAAAATGKSVAAVVKMFLDDDSIVNSMRDAGIDVYVIPAPCTTYSVVIHPVEDVDVRQLVLKESAGLIQIGEMPQIESRCLHLAGISDTEFDLDLIALLAQREYSLSTDMQSFVRQVDPTTREISFGDVEAKREIVAYMDKVKLDVVEAEILTGTRDLAEAARIVQSWGCPEVVITRADGVLVCYENSTHFEKFSNCSSVGRTGRGDTTFAAYCCRRLDYGPVDALRFAAALVSLKMESSGPFAGSIDDVLVRMEAEHSADKIGGCNGSENSGSLL